MLVALLAPLSFSPRALPAQVARPAVRSECPMMRVEPNTRRELLARVGAALGAMSAVGGASAKKGEFGKVGIFGMSDLSSPYVPGGPKGCSPERADSCGATFGYAANGTPLAQGYQSDVGREKLAFEESARRISSLQPKIDSKTWWFVRDELRIQAYNMRSSMKALNGVAADKAAAQKAYQKYWVEVEQFDLACNKKEAALANKKFADVLAALKAYRDVAV